MVEWKLFSLPSDEEKEKKDLNNKASFLVYDELICTSGIIIFFWIESCALW